MYMEPALMVTDALSFLIHQKKILILIERMEKVNQKLIKENIVVDLGRVRLLSIILISLITATELGLVTYNYLVFKDALWFIPIYLTTLAKVFYVAMVFILKEFLQAINNHLETTKIFFEESKLLRKQRFEDVVDPDEMGFLRREILTNRSTVMTTKKNLLSHGDDGKVVNAIPYDDNGWLV